MALDSLKREIEVGDYVAYNPPYMKGLRIGKVVKFTPKMVTIDKDMNPEGHDTCNWYSSEVLVVTEQIAIAKDKYTENWI